MANNNFAWAMAILIGVASVTCAPIKAMARGLGAEARDTKTHAVRSKQVVAAAFDRWAAGGSDFFREMLAPDVVWTIEGSGRSAGTYRGVDDFNARAIRPFVSRLRTPVRPTSKRLWAEGDHVIINWVGEAVARDGRPYRNHYVWIFRMRGDKAVEVNAFLDLAPYEDVIRRVPAPDDESGNP